eukprot:gene19066-21686_t
MSGTRMNNSLSRRVILGLLALSASSWSQSQTAKASWPEHAVKLIVGFPAGSSPDLTARALAEPLAKAL